MSDMIQEASEESFPASDPPAWTPLHIGPPIHEPPKQGVGSVMECHFCGKPTELQIDGMPLCEECYENAGSCCLEFGGGDLWQRKQKGSAGTLPGPDSQSKLD